MPEKGSPRQRRLPRPPRRRCLAGAPSSLACLLLLAAGCCLLLLASNAARLPTSLAPNADALLQLKSGIENDADVLRSWSPGTSPCNGDASNWIGVICHNNSLQLEKMGLSGMLDLRPLKSLRSLRMLSFMDNEFAGPMPNMRELRGLGAIYLSGNKYSREIPADAFARMGSLKKVFLSRKGFSGPIPASLTDVPRLLDLRRDVAGGWDALDR